jgi:DNA-binding response OmpR family regulator
MAGRLSILVVEDQQALLSMIVQILSEAGYSAIPASSAWEGLQVFENSPAEFDLAILDMVLPGMSGLDLAAELSRRRPELKVLYMSGYGSSVAMQSVRSAGAEFVLIKPFSARQLLDRIEALVAPG